MVTPQMNSLYGLYQGDPLSPFLFIIATEPLGFLINLGINKGHLKGVKMGVESHSFSISHLCFADGTLHFTTPHI